MMVFLQSHTLLVIVKRFHISLTSMPFLNHWFHSARGVIWFYVAMKMMVNFAIVIFCLILCLRDSVIVFRSYHVRVMGIILNLFGDAEWEALKASPASTGHSESSLCSEAVSPSADSRIVRGIRRDSVVCHWCAGCELDGLCDSDQCAARPQSVLGYYEQVSRHLSNGCYMGRFPSLGAFISFKKRQGWL